jgi:hypothetical protein
VRISEEPQKLNKFDSLDNLMVVGGYENPIEKKIEKN